MIFQMDRRCLGCGKFATIEVPDEQGAAIIAWASGQDTRLIQDALPFLTIAQREILITGTHEKCFDEMFPEEEEDDGD